MKLDRLKSENINDVLYGNDDEDSSPAHVPIIGGRYKNSVATS